MEGGERAVDFEEDARGSMEDGEEERTSRERMEQEEVGKKITNDFN